jgi:hypothetical protein
MRIYIGHPSSIEFQKDLYEPIRASALNNQHEIILPHETSNQPTNTLELMKTFDLMIAEVSEASTGLGIEMGWANLLNLPIIAIYREGKTPSSSIQTIINEIHSYNNDTFISLLKNLLK